MTVTLDWRQTGAQTWEIEIETNDATKLKLVNGGAQLEIEEQPPFVGPEDEYADIYNDSAALLAAGRSNVDSAPFQLVADAFMVGERKEVDAFDF